MQFSTKSSDPAFRQRLSVQFGAITLYDCKDLVVCGSSNPGGDAVMGLELTTGARVSEVLQDKFAKVAIPQKRFAEERLKSVDGYRDFFILLKTAAHGAHWVLPPRTALVERSNFIAYFCAFADRANFFLDHPAPNVNVASRLALEAVDGLDLVSAGQILKAVNERKKLKRLFESSDELEQAVPGNVLQNVRRRSTLSSLRYRTDCTALSTSIAASAIIDRRRERSARWRHHRRPSWRIKLASSLLIDGL